jgi:hypothetical protein
MEEWQRQGKRPEVRASEISAKLMTNDSVKPEDRTGNWKYGMMEFWESEKGAKGSKAG